MMNISPMPINTVNALDQARFIELLGGIFEHSPWIAEQVFDAVPFANVAELHTKMVQLVEQGGMAKQLALICAHPELTGKINLRDQLTEHSKSEQSGAGLNQCSTEEYADLINLNTAYTEKFGFPFILAVKGHDRQSIIANFRLRLKNTREAEFKECLGQIYRIAGFRLAAVIE